ncbi:mucin-5AC-like isoform X21 [Seriola aureovittata]|uniref:mucin-5AC-like isoform X21 n=1 Tax=Seriola aureovittata TaxID=2871759 RepID=UPI0024BD6747|nr:mucin-5AC-like isoform X21 [Seriola aureovittata]
MNIHHVLLFCFLSALCGGFSGLVSAKPPIFTGPEGGHGTISCHLNVSGSRKFFCREECKEEDILIRTDKFSAKSGRYSIRYKNKGSSGGSILSVTITNLTQSDSGQYRCGLGTSAVPDLFEDFEVRISDALVDRNSGFFLTNVEGDKVQFSCRDAVNSSRMFLCRGECKKQEDILIETDKNKDQSGRYTIEYKEGSAFGQYVTITQVVKSDSGRYRCGYGRALSPDSYHMFLLLVDTSTPTTTQSLSSSSGRSTPSPVFPETSNQPSAAAPTTSKPIRTLQPFSTSVPSASTPTTTQSLSSSSGRSTPSPVFPETFNQPSAAATTTSKPIRTLQPFSTSVLSASTPTTIQSLSSSSGTSTPSPVFPETTNQPTAAAPTTSKPIRTLQPFSTSVPSASTPTTTQSLSSSSGRSTPSPVFPETSNQPSAAAPTTSKPIRTLQPFSTSVPSASTPTTTQSLSSSSGRSTPSPVFPETFNQPSAAAPTTSKPIRTLQPFSTSVPSASTPTTTQSLSSSSGRSTPSPVFPETSNQPSVAAFSDAPHPTSSYVPSYLLPLVVCVLLLGLLLLVGFLLLLYIQKTRKNKEPKH